MNAIARLAVSAFALVVRPRTCFRENREDPGLAFSIFFAVVMGALAGVAGNLVGGAGLRATIGHSMLGEVIGDVVLAIIAAFAIGGFVHLVSLLAGGSPGYESSVRIACLALLSWPVANAVGAYEPLSLAALIYGIVLIGLGIAEMHDAGHVRAILTAVMTTVLLAGAIVLAGYGLHRSITRDVFVQVEQQQEEFADRLLKAKEAAAAANARANAADQRVAAGGQPQPAVPDRPADGDSAPQANTGQAAEPAPAAGDTITLPVRVRSVPSGARVALLPRGDQLGVTPFTWHVPKGAEPVNLRFSLAGYAEQVREVDGDVEAEVLVRLERPAAEADDPAPAGEEP